MKKVTVFWPPESLKKSRFNLQLIISFAILLFTFISCNNLINSDDNSYSQNPSGTEEYINFTGRCSLDGAYPRQFASASTQNTGMEGRSALPQIDSSYEYFVEASSADGKTSTGGVNPNLTFSIPLAINHTWTITAGIRKTGSTDKIVFSAESDPVTPDRTATSFENLNLILKPCQSGSGSVSLAMTVPAAVKKIETECCDTNWKDKIETGVESSEAYIRSKSDGSNVNTVKSGIYNIIIKFYDVNDFILYSIPQTVNVIDDMDTNLWCSGGSSDSPITEAGLFSLQSDHISKYTSTIIYVGPNSATSSTADSNEGRAYSPLATVNEAIKRIRNANVSHDYRIFVSGERAENIKIGGEGADVLPGTAASSITIQGLNNNAADVLMAPQLSTAPCLSIQTDIPVIFKNIKITTSSSSHMVEYNTSAQGGGLYIKTGAASPGVTLDSGALIDNCIISGTEAKGAGIYLDSGKLTIKTGAKISNNHFPNSDGFGGGIYIKSGAELILSGSFDIPYGGSVTQNDIYVEAADSIKIKNAISPQSGTSGAMATITPAQDLQRGVSIVSLASGSSLSSIVPYKDYFALSNNDWIIKANGAGNALVLDAPIYVAGQTSHPYTGVAGKAPADGGTGSKSAPLDTIANACALMSDPTWDYTILVDGTITRSQISARPSAHSITLKGANSFTSNDDRKDIINAGGSGTALSILYILAGETSVPVTIENLKITGGSQGSGGAGIHIGNYRNVTLGDDLLVQENNGPGVYVSSSGATLNVNGNVVVSGNKVYNDTIKSCNVYLPDGKTINVFGALKKGDEKAQIGISTENPPTLTSTIAFTANYGIFNSVAPGTYFTGDQWTVAAGSDGEACLAASGGNITIEPVYEDITINVDKTSVLKSASEKKFTFTATGTDSEGNTNPITIGSGEGQLALTIDSVTYHGETVPASYYDTGTDYVTLGNSLPADNYTINTRAVYQGSLSEARTYSASFEVKIKESIIENVSSGSQAVSVISAMTESGTIKYTGALTTAEIQSMKDALKALNTTKPDVEVTLDLSGVTGYTSIGTCYDFFYENPNIVSLTFPEGITEIPAGCLRGLSKLKTLNLPSTVQTFGVEQICYLCPLLETVTIGGDPAGDNGTVKVVNNVVYSSDGKKLWFYGNKASTADLVVPDGVEEIYKWAFATSHFTKITLPSSLKTVGFGAFIDLDSTLTTVNYKGSESDKSSITIEGWNEAITNLTWNYNYTGD